MEKKILLIEDEKNIARVLELELKHEGFQVVIANNGIKGLEKVKNEEFHLVLLDIMLPGINGIEVCQEIRNFSNIPIIMVTAKDEVNDKVKGLDVGADDYITKPFATEELLARIRALLRRQEKEDETKLLQIADLTIDLNKYQVKRAGQNIELTKKEYDLLVYLLENRGIVMSREKLLSNVWGYDYLGKTNIVDVYIRYLRSKIDDPFNLKLIQTVRGVGYVLRIEEK